MNPRLPMIVVHGGPGLTSRYLVKSLARVFQGRRLIFYDQPHEPQEKVSRVAYRNQLQNLIDQHQECGVITHSFGAAVLFDLLQHCKVSNLASTILISPVPKRFNTWEHCVGQLVERLPKAVLDGFTQTDKKDQQKFLAAVRELFAHYMYDPRNGRHLELDAYRQDVFDRIVQEFAGWDFNGIEQRLPEKTLCVYGSNDWCRTPSQEYEVETAFIPKSGHFCFLEQEGDLTNAIRPFP